MNGAPETTPSPIAEGVPTTHELKYVVPAAAAGSVEAWLAAVSGPERDRPPAYVFTVYFDTPGLALLDQKRNSDYLKIKVRIRWYGTLDGRPGGAAYSEVKQRVGNRREKHRVRLGTDAAVLAKWPLADPRWMGLLAPLRAFARLPPRLLPTLALRYRRSRYIEATSRLALDQQIPVTAAHPHLAAGHLPAWLPLGVFECKGPESELPARLGPIVRFGARRSSFSKYQACMQAVSPHAF